MGTPAPPAIFPEGVSLPGPDRLRNCGGQPHRHECHRHPGDGRQHHQEHPANPGTCGSALQQPARRDSRTERHQQHETYPHRHSGQLGRCLPHQRDLRDVGVLPLLEKVEDPGAARIHSGGEGCPGHRRLRGLGSGQRSEGPLPGQTRKIRKVALRDHRRDGVRVRSIESKDHHAFGWLRVRLFLPRREQADGSPEKRRTPAARENAHAHGPPPSPEGAKRHGRPEVTAENRRFRERPQLRKSSGGRRHRLR